MDSNTNQTNTSNYCCAIICLLLLDISEKLILNKSEKCFEDNPPKFRFSMTLISKLSYNPHFGPQEEMELHSMLQAEAAEAFRKLSRRPVVGVVAVCVAVRGTGSCGIVHDIKKRSRHALGPRTFYCISPKRPRFGYSRWVLGNLTGQWQAWTALHPSSNRMKSLSNLQCRMKSSLNHLLTISKPPVPLLNQLPSDPKAFSFGLHSFPSAWLLLPTSTRGEGRLGAVRSVLFD